MERLTVTLGERSYPITIAAGLFNDPASFLPLKSGDQAMLVTNETLAPLYLDTVRSVLEQAGVNVDSVILPDGEQYKSLAVMDTVFTALLQKPHGRDTTLVAPDQRAAADVALQIEIGLARAALERGDDTAYRAALTRVDAWLPRLWPDSPARRQVHARLRTLQQAQAPARPTEVGSTLQQLRALRSAGMRLRPTRETPEVMP